MGPWRGRLAPAASAALLAGWAAGCSTPAPAPTRVAQAPPVAPITWARVGAATRIAAAAAEREAQESAHRLVADWVTRVRERSAAEFVPWLTGYWAQQWLSVKLAWYRMNDADGDPAAATGRLAEYLQGEFRTRVLEPVAESADPRRFMDRVTARYLQAIAEGIRPLPARFGVPEARFEHWLAGIPAIAWPPGASLGALVGAADLAALPAYQALAGAVHAGADDSDRGQPREALEAFARRTAERLSTALAVRGGSAAASLAGGVPGLLLALGVTAWDASRHEQERPALEATLVEELERALEAAHRDLLDDPERGVLAGVRHIAAQLDNALPGGPAPDASPAIERLW